MFKLNYFDKETNTGARNWNIHLFLGQDRLRLKDENVFIYLKCCFPFSLFPHNDTF